MEIWGILLILIIIALSIGLVLGLYYTIKTQYHNTFHLLDKSLKQNDQSIASFCLGPSHYIKRPSSQPQKDFIESFIDYSKEQPSRIGVVSSGNGTERPKMREESDIAQKTDRSIDFLLLSTTRRGKSLRCYCILSL